MIKNPGKKVWYDGQLWDVVKVYSPNKCDDFIFIQRENGLANKDDSNSVDMWVVDAHNDEYFPDNPKVRGLVGIVWPPDSNTFVQKQNSAKEKLKRIWLDQ